MTDKASLRKEAFALRKKAHASVDPAPALAHLLAELENTAGPVSFYWPIRTEIDPRPAVVALGARLLSLPVTHRRGTPLTFRQWTPETEMEIDEFGVGFPAEDRPVTPEVLVVPMLAFDRRGHRLGYGAGHYDRTLAGLRKSGPVLAIGFAYSAQELPTLPIEVTDEPLDLIVTEQGVVELSR